MARQPKGLRINHAPARWPRLLLVSRGLSPWSLHALSLQLGCWVGRSWQGPGDPTSPVWTWVCWEPCPNASSPPNPDPQQLPTHKPKNSLGSWDPENRQQSDAAPRSPRELGLPCQALPRLDVRGSQALPRKAQEGQGSLINLGCRDLYLLEYRSCTSKGWSSRVFSSLLALPGSLVSLRRDKVLCLPLTDSCVTWVT